MVPVDTAETRNAFKWLEKAFRRVADETGVPAERLGAICWRETLFGRYLDKDGKGDKGHGHGLMQIDDRFHAPWLATHVWRLPYWNISKGAEIYQSGRAWLSAKGLAGAALDRAALAAYNAGPIRVLAACRAGYDPDQVTTGRDYATFVEMAEVLCQKYLEEK